MAIHFKRKFKYVTIAPSDEGETLGHVHYRRTPKQPVDYSLIGSRDRARIEKKVMIAIAGDAAEANRSGGRRNHSGARSDYASVIDWLLEFNGSEEVASAHRNWLWFRTVELIRDKWNWKKIEAIAQALMKRTKLQYSEVLEISREVDDNMMRPVQQHVEALKQRAGVS
jgi:hypothetical protein